MCKKLCLAVGAVIVGLVVITFTGLGTKMQVKWQQATQWMDSKVAPETKLQELRVHAGKIDKDIKKHLGTLAAMEVEYERLDANLTVRKKQQADLREEIVAMNKALDSKEEPVIYGTKKYRQSELAMRLESKVHDYELAKTEIKTKEQVLASKRQALESAHERINAMRVQKEELRATIASLEARIEALKVKQVNSLGDVDDTEIAKCKVLADNIDRQLAEEEKKLQLYQVYGYDKESKNGFQREKKTVDDVRQAATKALQDDDDKVISEK
jgi:chromosome segregation ATPase